MSLHPCGNGCRFYRAAVSSSLACCPAWACLAPDDAPQNNVRSAANPGSAALRRLDAAEPAVVEVVTLRRPTR